MLLQKAREFTIEQKKPVSICFYGSTQSGKTTLMNNVLHEMYNEDQIEAIYCIKTTPEQTSIRDALLKQYPDSRVSDLVTDVVPKEEDLIDGVLSFKKFCSFIEQLNGEKVVVIVEDMDKYINKHKVFERQAYAELTRHVKRTGVNLWTTQTNDKNELVLDVHTVLSNFIFLTSIEEDGDYQISFRVTTDEHQPGYYKGVRLMETGDIDYD